MKNSYQSEGKEIIPFGIGEIFYLKRLKSNLKNKLPFDEVKRPFVYHLYQGASIGLASYPIIKGLELLLQ